MTARPRKVREMHPLPPPRPLAEYSDPMLVPEVAEVLRCSVAHVRKLIVEDGLRCARWGLGRGKVVIYREDLIAYINRKRGIA